MITRPDSDQDERSMKSVSSVTQAPSQTLPSVSTAGIRSSFWTRSRASRTLPSIGYPMEKSQLAASMASLDEPVGGPGRIGPHQDGVSDQFLVVTGEVAELVLLGQARHGPVEEYDVVVGVVGPGIPRTQHGGQGLTGGVTPHSEGEEPEPILASPSGS